MYAEFHRQYPNVCDIPNSSEDSILKKRPSSLVLQGVAGQGVQLTITSPKGGGGLGCAHLQISNLQLNVQTTLPKTPDKDESSPSGKDATREAVSACWKQDSLPHSFSRREAVYIGVWTLAVTVLRFTCTETYTCLCYSIPQYTQLQVYRIDNLV